MQLIRLINKNPVINQIRFVRVCGRELEERIKKTEAKPIKIDLCTGTTPQFTL